jgi:hypothetical protein
MKQLLLMASLASLGCASRSSQTPGVSAQDPAAAPAPAADAAAAELRRVTAEIQVEVEELRGERFRGPVNDAVADGGAFRDYVQARIDATETPAEIAADEEIAKLLGLLPEDYDYVEEMLELVESQVGGFYDPASKTFYLMEGFEGDVARIILAHELTHALDDQIFDIDDELPLVEGNSDAEWAYHAVIEGSGTAVMNRWTMERIKSLDIASMTDLATMGADVLKEAPPYLWKPLVGAYLRGEAFLKDRPAELDLAQAVRRGFEAPPRTSEQILHPEKYWDPEQRDDPQAVAFAREGLPEGWEVLGEDTFGELGLALLVEPPGARKGANPLSMMTARMTSAASEGWDGDRCLLVARGESDRLLVLASVWDTEAEAEEFVEALEKLREHLLAGPADELEITREGERVVLVASRGAGKDLAEDARGWVRVGPG